METKPTQTDKVDTYIAELNHPLKDVIVALRTVILGASTDIGEEIKWNAPTYFYSGEMAPSDPKLFKRYLIVTNLHRPKTIMLVFPSGARIDDGSGFLTGTYADGRRLHELATVAEVKESTPELQKLIKKWLATLEKE